MSWDLAPTCNLVTQAFGCTPYPEWWVGDYCPATGQYHDGIDLSHSAGSCGLPLCATRAGVVRSVGTIPGQAGLGDRALVIDADAGVHLLFGHCERVYVSPGQRVSPDQHVAEIGTRGYSNGCHVHFAVKLAGYLSAAPPAGCLDPVPYLESIAGGPPLMNINTPVVAAFPTPSGRGYTMVCADGGVFPFGDAAGLGSMGGQAMNHPVVAAAGTPSGRGYWLFGADGGVFPFGDAGGYGSIPGLP